MKLLLDTHIWLWLLQNPARIGRRTLQQLKDTNNEIWLSPISTWEALTLHYENRIRLYGDLTEWLVHATAGTREAPVTHEIAPAARLFPLHRDPADRMLVATAQLLDLTLVTADQRLPGLGNVKTLANR